MRHAIIVDLGFGDAGKGSVVDWLASPAASAVAGLARPPVAVVRFNGGAQAGHNVVTPDGRHHCFAQFGSATLHGVPTVLSRHMLVEPLAVAAEARALAALGVPDPLGLLRVDVDALLTTPYHAAVNQARETARGAAAHGSCGMGIGETVAYDLAHPEDAPRVRDIMHRSRLRRLLQRMRDRTVDTINQVRPTRDPAELPSVDTLLDVYRQFARVARLVDAGYLRRVARAGRLVFEGAQGVLLDETNGFHPHTTWSRTTFENASELLTVAGVDVHDRDQVLRVGVTRTYATRHGSGPLVSEDASLLPLLPEPHNTTGRWQGAFRVGHLDLVALRYAVDVCAGIDALAVTHLDTAANADRRAPGALQVAAAWYLPSLPGPLLRRLHLPTDGPSTQLTGLAFHAQPVLRSPPTGWAALLHDELATPVLVQSWGPTWTHKLPNPVAVAA
ncbi:MAG TPA: adenylosuccinate synthetase [Actinomycetes bacterium]|nr:adenylosuccinate synthetase [Actinomycetes bacterium]